MSFSYVSSGNISSHQWKVRILKSERKTRTPMPMKRDLRELEESLPWGGRLWHYAVWATFDMCTQRTDGRVEDEQR